MDSGKKRGGTPEGPVNSPGLSGGELGGLPIRRARRQLSEQARGVEPLRAGDQPPPVPLEALPPPYENRGELGRGGMGVVYRAYDPPNDREVAIKFLPPSGNSKDAARRFQREAKELAGLSHPNIVAFYTAGQYKKRDYLVMELVDGKNLSEIFHATPGTVPLVDVCGLFAQVSDGLAHIHASGVVHRDLKPANVLLHSDGTAKISDFGLARSLEDRSQLTSTGAIVGTISYLAPEQIVSSGVGPAADLYSLGCCLFEAVTGRSPFLGDTEFALLNKHVKETPPNPSSLRPDVPPELDSLILRLLKKAPTERPHSADEVARQLRSLRARMTTVTNLGALGALAGRDELVEQMQKALSPPVSMLLTAPAGMGRSVVVRELYARLKASGLRMTLVSAELGHPVPLAEVYGELGGDVKRFVERWRVAGPLGAALLLRDLLAQGERPTLLLIDDLSRLSETTNALVDCLVRLEPPPNAGWLISCCTERAARLEPHPSCRRIELQPLPDALLARLAENRLGHPLDAELAAELARRSGGSPRELSLLLLALQGSRSLTIENDVYTATSWPESTVDAILHQVGRGEEADLKILRAASLMGEPLGNGRRGAQFPFAMVLQLAGLTSSEAEETLGRLLACGIWEEVWNRHNEEFQFASAALRDGLEASLADRSRRRMHSRLAALFEEQGMPAMAGLHRSLADPAPAVEALPLLLAGIEKAWECGDFIGCYEVCLRARELGGDDAQRWKWAPRLAESLWIAGRTDLMLELLPPLLSSVPDAMRTAGARVALALAKAMPPEGRVELCRTWLPYAPELCLSMAEALEAESRFGEALDALSVSNRPPSYWPLAGRLMAAMGRKDEAQTLFRQGDDKLERLSLPETYRLWAEWSRLDDEPEELLDRGVELAALTRDRPWQAYFQLEAGESRIRSGDWTGAEAPLTECLTHLDAALEGRARASLAVLYAETARPDLAASNLEVTARCPAPCGPLAALLRAAVSGSKTTDPLPEVPANSFEEGLLLALRCRRGEEVDVVRARELVSTASSRIAGDPLRSWRVCARTWLTQAVVGLERARETAELSRMPPSVVIEETPEAVEAAPAQRSRTPVALVALAAVAGVAAMLLHRPAPPVVAPAPTPVVAVTQPPPPLPTPSATASPTPVASGSVTPSPSPSAVASAIHQVSFALKDAPMVVKIDGQPHQAETTPYNVTLNPGSHEVIFAKDGYVPQQTTVVVTAGQLCNASQIAPLEREMGDLIIHAQPSDAVLEIDGRSEGKVGDAGLKLHIATGEHRYKLTLTGYRPESGTVEVRLGLPTGHTIALNPIVVHHAAPPRRPASPPPRGYSAPRPAPPAHASSRRVKPDEI